MHNAFAHCAVTNAQPVTPAVNSGPQQSFPLVYVLSMTPHGLKCPFGQLWSAVLAATLPDFLCTPPYLLAGQHEKERSLTTVQQQLKHQCVTNMIVLNLKHRATPGTVKKINSTPVNTRKICYLD